MQIIEITSGVAALLLALGPVSVAMPAARQGPTLTYGLTAVLSLVLMAAGAMTLVNGGSALTLPLGLPWIGARFALDALSGFFMLVLGLGGAVISVYAIGYGRHDDNPGRVLAFYAPFIGAMSMVLMAADAFTFLLSWEIMSLLSWALVLAHHGLKDTRKAAYVYLVMAAFGTFSLLLAFGLLAGTQGGYGFAEMRAAVHAPWVTPVVLILMLIGAGSKAGLVPLHVWLPLAHPAAPSHVSALMSGIMTKVAIYGFIRVAFDLLGTAPWWMAMIVMVLGGITAVLGVFQALMERDLKRLLAYSTVENIGIIFIGLGLSMAFRADGLAAGAALALTAALLHIFNHSLFKSLLFMGSGVILNATGTRDLEKMGGLIHRMPITAIVFLAGSLAISALPPFNGFASEWLTFQAILASPELTSWGLKFATPAVGGLLALAAALAATTFVKVYGIAFLGRPRGEAVANAVETDRFSLGAMAFFAGLCLLAGILPGMFMDMLSPVTSGLLGHAMPVQGENPWATITPIIKSQSSYNGLLVMVFIAFSAGASAWMVHRFASRKLRRAPAWDCGFPNADPITQYTAGSLAQPVRRVLGTSLMAARETVIMPPPGNNAPARIKTELRDLIWETVYERIEGLVMGLSTKMNRLQFLTIRRYLSLVFALLVLLLLGLTLWT